jgi:D-3-phosphoglycerate dehydrogenase
MARSVAEGVLAYILAGLRRIPQQYEDVRLRRNWEKRVQESRTLFGARVSLIGLGTIGKYLLDLLKPFDVRVRVYDPYLSEDALDAYSNVERASLEAALAWGDVISIHASLTSETRGMLNLERLKLIRDGALFVNTARGAIVDESALAQQLRLGRFDAILDVFVTEPLPDDSPLRGLENAILLPHVAGSPAREEMTYAMLAEIERWIRGEPLLYEISYERFSLMTKEAQEAGSQG